MSHAAYAHSTTWASHRSASTIKNLSPARLLTHLSKQTALDYIISHPILGPSDSNPSGPKIILYGQSLGGAVALDLAVRNANSITGLILENTFLSIVRLSPSSNHSVLSEVLYYLITSLATPDTDCSPIPFSIVLSLPPKVGQRDSNH